MSRVLISTLALGAVTLLSSTSAHSQPLNINPFPMQKAGTLSVQEPQVMTPEPVEIFAKEAEEEIKRLQAEKEALEAERARSEQIRREAQERAEARKIEAEDKARALAEEKERLGAIERENAAIAAQAKADAEQLKREKDALAEALIEREEQKAIELQKQADEVLRLKQENEALAGQLAKREEMQAAIEAEELAQQEQARIEQQQAAEAEALERENAALAQKLKAMQEQEQWEAQKAALEPLLETNPEVISLQEKNRELASELRGVQAQKRKQAEIDMAMRALEAQKRADIEAQGAVHDGVHSQVNSTGVDPLFESAAVGDNPVGMTPMIMESKPLKSSDIIEVRASDLGLVEPKVTVLNDVKNEPRLSEPSVKLASHAAVQVEDQAARAVNLDTARIQVLPYDGQLAQTRQAYAPMQPAYRSANVGESLEDVLRSWSQSEGIGFLWKTTQRFDVLNPVSDDGNYEASVQTLLDQHSAHDVRPVGKLQTDPVTGMRTLSILTE